MSDNRGAWIVSALATIFFLAYLNHMWMSKYDSHRPNENQLATSEAVDAFLESAWGDGPPDATEPTLEIPTGIFVQSLNFLTASDIQVTGYIWQRFAADFPEEEQGFILPEQVNSGSDIEPREVYRRQIGDEVVVGWYFEATLRQNFDYSDFPFDHKTAWVRMWPRGFDKNIVLTPDLKSYKSTGLDDAFGLEPTIVMGGWHIEETFFDYKLSNYDTNFGLETYTGQDGFPELYFNIVIKRKTINAVVVHLIPLFVVAILLFYATLSVSGDKEKASIFGFSPSGVAASCSALFFVVIVAHIQLREEFAGAGVVYLEYFYFVLYAAILLTAANAFLFTAEGKVFGSFTKYRDNLLPKVLFFPIMLGIACIVTELRF